jgi:hypothetical protein
MRGWRPIAAIVGAVGLAAASPAAGAADAVCAGMIVFDGRYCRVAVEEWTAMFDMALIRDYPRAASDVLSLMRERLRDVVVTLPPHRVAELRRVPIWVGMNMSADRRTMYHPVGSAWPRQHGFPEAKIGSVDITNAGRFLRLERDQPSILFHELAHAYHDQVLGHRNQAVLRAYKNAVESGLYREVKRVNGRVGPAYALTNEREYFAELTEAYFGRNDFFPFVRAELQHYDPMGFEAVRVAWEEQPAQAEERVTMCTSALCCRDAGELRSRNSQTLARFVFRNATPQQVNVVWVDFKGAHKVYAEVPAGALHIQATFVTHPWLLMDVAGRCLAIVHPQAEGLAVRLGE